MRDTPNVKTPPPVAERLRKIDLCKMLGINRTTLDKYLNNDGAPTADLANKYNSKEVADYISANSDRLGKGDEIKKLRARKLGLECERLSHEIEISRGDWIARKEVAPVIARLWAELHELTRQKFEFELPSRYAGKNEIECAQLNAKALSDIDQRFKSNEEFKT